MIKQSLLLFVVCLSVPTLAHASEQLACKVYGQRGSAQLATETVWGEGTKKTFLNFSSPVAWYPDVVRFELVYASGGSEESPQTLVANATGANGRPQTVIIQLQPLAGNVRYGKVEAGDFSGDLGSTLRKRKEYEIQCFYSVPAKEQQSSDNG